jgi:hypothetical protein
LAALDALCARAAVDRTSGAWTFCYLFRPEHCAGCRIPAGLLRTLHHVRYDISLTCARFMKSQLGQLPIALAGSIVGLVFGFILVVYGLRVW